MANIERNRFHELRTAFMPRVGQQILQVPRGHPLHVYHRHVLMNSGEAERVGRPPSSAYAERRAVPIAKGG